MIDAKPIPDLRDVLVNFSPGHGVKDHQGHATIVSAHARAGQVGRQRERLHDGPLHQGSLSAQLTTACSWLKAISYCS